MTYDLELLLVNPTQEFDTHIYWSFLSRNYITLQTNFSYITFSFPLSTTTSDIDQYYYCPTIFYRLNRKINIYLLLHIATYTKISIFTHIFDVIYTTRINGKIYQGMVYSFSTKHATKKFLLNFITSPNISSSLHSAIMAIIKER